MPSYPGLSGSHFIVLRAHEGTRRESRRDGASQLKNCDSEFPALAQRRRLSVFRQCRRRAGARVCACRDHRSPDLAQRAAGRSLRTVAGSRCDDRPGSRGRGRVRQRARASEIAFGLNATSFIRSISLAIGQALGDRHGNHRHRAGPRGRHRNLGGARASWCAHRVVEGS